jgi:flagellar M-ring protein FliF
VALLVDGKYENDKYIARTAEEIELIKSVVKRAVGFDGERGDEIEVATVAFKVQPAAPAQPIAVPEIKDMLMSPMGIGIAAGAVVLIGVLAFLLMRRKRTPVQTGALRTAPEYQAAPAAAPDPAAQELSEEITEAAQKFVLKADPRKEQLTQIAKDYHDATVRIIRMWLQEDKSRAGHENDIAAERLN